MLKPASSLCNMRCKYCFYADVSNMRSVCSYGMMTKETVTKILKNLQAELTEGDRISFAFQGGEPTLAGLSFFEHFVSVVSGWKGVSVSYALQTNGVLLDENWCAFLKKHNFLVGISFDLLPDAHGAVRVDEKGKSTYKRVAESIKLLKKYRVEFNVLCTLTNSLARHPEKAWKELKRLEIDYVQFTPCIDDFESTGSVYALTPRRFAYFYSNLFQYWYNDYQKGNYLSVKFFDDVVNLLVLGRPTSCGMNGVCNPQLVVEADGSAYPCDFYCLDQYKLGNLTSESVTELLVSSAAERFTRRPTDIPALCKECKYKAFCGGNCPRMRREICCLADDGYCGYQDFLNKCGTEILLLAKQAQQKIYSK